MSSTAKTVLIVAGAGVGVFVLLKMLSPSPLVKAYGSQPPNTAGTIQGLTGLANAFKGLFGSSSSSSGLGSSSVDYHSDAASQAALSGLHSADTVTVTDNFIYTDANGDFIAG